MGFSDAGLFKVHDRVVGVVLLVGVNFFVSVTINELNCSSFILRENVSLDSGDSKVLKPILILK